LQFSEDAYRLVIVDERLPEYFFRSSSQARFGNGNQTNVSEMGVPPAESVLSQFKSPVDSTPKDALLEGSDNLALILHELDFLGVHDPIRDYLRRFCERFEDVKVSVGGGPDAMQLVAEALLEASRPCS
jgi:hypothetical protein